MPSQHEDLMLADRAQVVVRRHRATYAAVRLAISREKARIFFLAYSYFRWIDDVVDSSHIALEKKNALLARQRTLISATYADPGGVCPSTLDDAERCLYAVMQYDTTFGGLALLGPILDMLTSLELDAQRRGIFLSGDQLRRIQLHRIRAYSDGVLALFRGVPAVGAENNLYLFAEACDEAHKLRDMLQDIAFGYCNIPLEALAEYRVDLADPGSPGFRRYTQATVEATREKFRQSKKALLHESTTLRAACRVYSLRHEVLLKMIERDGYCLRPGYAFGPNDALCLLWPFGIHTT